MEVCGRRRLRMISYAWKALLAVVLPCLENLNELRWAVAHHVYFISVHYTKIESPLGAESLHT